MALRATARLTILGTDEEKPGGFGYGCVQLLRGVDEEKSLNRAAKRMGMAYSKAWRLLNEAEDQLGCKLLNRNGALGSTLTPEGRRAMEGYERLQAEVAELLARRVPELIPGSGD